MAYATFRNGNSPTPCRACLYFKRPEVFSVCHPQGKPVRCFRPGAKSQSRCAFFALRPPAQPTPTEPRPVRLPYND